MKSGRVLIGLVIWILLLVPSSGKETDADVSQHLQDISVTIRAGSDYGTVEGSGVIKTREINGKKVNFVWTAAHVVEDLRKVKTVIATDGTERKVVSFDDCHIVKELVEGGRRVGELKMDAEVIRYSDPEDLALLRIRKMDFVQASVKFHLDMKPLKIGTSLFHVGSLLGQAGSNSMTSGIVSQIGRVIDKKAYDQTTVTAFPGSSGGGVYLEDGLYVGMIVRGAGESFNLMVPIRRMFVWAKEAKVAWAIDDSVEAPSEKELEDLPIEDIGTKFNAARKKSLEQYPYLIIRERVE